MNYQLYNQHDISQKQHKLDVDPAMLNNIVFNQKPKRVYKANKSANIGLHDAKRVHTALREFNDMSANAVFNNILQQIEELDEAKNFKVQFNAPQKPKPRGSLAGGSAGDDFFDEKAARSGTMVGKGGFDQQPQGVKALQTMLDSENATQEDIIANVEVMLSSEKRTNEKLKKGVPKSDPQAQGFDLNTGVLAPVKAVEKPKPQAKKAVEPEGP